MKTKESDLKKSYLRRLVVGIVLIVGLAIPAAVDSQSAIKSLHNRPADWLPNSIPVKAAFQEFSNRFNVSDVLMIAWPGSEVNSDSIDEVTDLLRKISEAGSDEAGSDDGAGDATDSDGESAESESEIAESKFLADVERVCETPTPLMWVRSGSEMIAQLTSAPANMSDRSARRRLSGTLIGPDNQHTCVIVSMGERGTDHRRELLPMIREQVARIAEIDVPRVAMVGGPQDGALIDHESIRSIDTFSPPSSLIAAVLCFLCLRSIPLTAVIVIVAVIGQGLVLAMVYYTGRDMNAVLIVLPPLIFVLTISAGIHLSNYFLDIIREFPQRGSATAAAAAMKAGVMPCVLATSTTVVGLSSLLLVRLEPVRIFGAVASIGVSLTLLLLILVLPGAMILTRRKPAPSSDAMDPDAAESGENEGSSCGGGLGTGSAGGHAPDGRFFRWVRRRLTHPWPTMILFVSIAGFCSLGLTRLHSSVNVSRMFLPESDLRQMYQWFEANVGPTATGDVVLRYPLNDDSDALERLADVIKVHRAILDIPDVGGVLSPASFVPSIPRSRRLSAAATRNVIRGLLDDPESSVGRLGYIASDADHTHWRLTIRLNQNQDANFGPRIKAIDEAVRNAVADFEVVPEVKLTGHIVIVEASQEILLGDLFKSFLTAFAIIAVVMVVMLRSVIGGLLAMLPNLFPTVTLFGTMGLIGLPLDIGSVMSASVALGIAVDDTVHLLSRFGCRRARGLGQIRSAHGAVQQCGMAMFHTTLVCSTALMAYYFSDFVPTSRFSLFMFGLLGSALLGVLVLLPSMMASRLGRFLSRTVGADADAAVHADQAGPADHRRLA